MSTAAVVCVKPGQQLMFRSLARLMRPSDKADAFLCRQSPLPTSTLSFPQWLFKFTHPALSSQSHSCFASFFLKPMHEDTQPWGLILNLKFEQTACCLAMFDLSAQTCNISFTQQFCCAACVNNVCLTALLACMQVTGEMVVFLPLAICVMMNSLETSGAADACLAILYVGCCWCLPHGFGIGMVS